MFILYVIRLVGSFYTILTDAYKHMTAFIYIYIKIINVPHFHTNHDKNIIIFISTHLSLVW